MGEEIPVLAAPATVVPPPLTPAETTGDAKATAMPTTTSEEDRHTRSQRFINSIWELTQAVIAQLTVGVILYVAAKIALTAMDPNITDRQLAMATTAFVLLSNMSSLVIGFYFGRTNHTRTGGVQDGR